MKTILFYIILIVILVSCEEVVEWDQQEVFTPRLVVDGMITNNPDFNYIRLSLPVTESGSEPKAVSNARVKVSSLDSVISFYESEDEAGLFLPEIRFRAVVNRTYLLNIESENYSFYASAEMVPVAPLETFRYTESEYDSGMFVINENDTNSPSMIRYIVEWTDSSDESSHKTVFYHYTLSTVDVNQFFKPEQELLSFPSHARVIREQYSLSSDYERYIRSLLSETIWRGGWFDVLPGNLYTNLSTGGVGYFAASSLVTDTVYFN